MVEVKSVEFFTVKFDLPARGDNTLAKKAKMENDAGLADRTTLTPVQIVDLLNFVLRSTYFQYNGSIYEQ